MKSKVLIWVIFGATVLIIFFIWDDVKSTRVYHFINTTGTVVGIGTNGRGGATYVHYTFKAKGKSFIGWVPKQNCADCAIGSLVKVKYSENNPSFSGLGVAVGLLPCFPPLKK
jgi:hypothetical protein